MSTGWNPKTAMVLAAGLGKRMRPLTDDRPKPLVKFQGRALLDHVLDRLVGAGIETAVLNMHYRGEKIQDYAASHKGPPRLILSDERDALLDTGGGVVRALGLLGDDAFIIHNSDSIWQDNGEDNLKSMIRAWDPRTMDSLLLLAHPEISLGYDGKGDFELTEDGRVVRPNPGMPAPFVFTGVSIAHPRLFRDAPCGAFSLNFLWNRAIKDGRLHGCVLDGTWMHLGTPDALKKAEEWSGHA